LLFAVYGREQSLILRPVVAKLMGITYHIAGLFVIYCGIRAGK